MLHLVYPTIDLKSNKNRRNSLIGLNVAPAGSGSGLVVSWEQQTGTLLASGDVRFIRVWDTHREMRMQVNVSMTRILSNVY